MPPTGRPSALVSLSLITVRAPSDRSHQPAPGFIQIKTVLNARVFKLSRESEADFYVGNRTNWIQWDCAPFVSDGRIELDMKAIVGRVPPLNETNLVELHGNATVENRGGMVFRAPDPNDASGSLVLVIGVKTIGAAETSLEVDTNMIAWTSSGRRDIYHKLNQIHLNTVSYNYTPLSDVLRDLHKKSLLLDPEKSGINFFYNPNIEAVDPATSLPVKSAPRDAVRINIPVNLTDVSLANLLDTICLIADHPLKYSIEDYGIVFSPKDPNAAKCEMRTFKVDTSKLYSALRERLLSSVSTIPDPQAGGFSVMAQNISSILKEYFQSLNVNLQPPETISFNDRLGILFVYATPQDLNVIEHALATMNVGTAGTMDFRQQASDLARDGKQFYEMGKLGDALKIFAWALALDPDNQDAQYYHNLIDAKLGVGIFGGTRIIGSQSVVLPARATLVPYYLARPNSGTFPDGVFDPSATHPSYQQVSAPVNPADLITNYFRINMAAFNEAVREETGETNPLDGFKELAAASGADLSPPKEVFVIEHFGELQDLHIVATRKDMGVIMRILDGFHLFPPQIHIKARFIEVPRTFLDDERDSIPSSITNGGVLTHAQFLPKIPASTAIAERLPGTGRARSNDDCRAADANAGDADRTGAYQFCICTINQTSRSECGATNQQ